MYININEREFIQRFEAFGRANNFSLPALRVLFAYYEGVEESTGAPIELDVIAICCDWVELDVTAICCDWVELFGDHEEVLGADDDYDFTESVVNRLKDETLVLPVKHPNAPDTYLVMAH